MAEDAIFQQNDVFPNIRAVSDHCPFSDICRADDVRARFDDGSFGDVNGRIAQVRAGVNVAEDCLGVPDETGNVFFEGFERFPDVFRAIEQAEGNWVGEGEEVGGVEHFESPFMNALMTAFHEFYE